MSDYEPYVMTKKTRLTLMIVALLLLFLVVLWLIFRSSNSELKIIADRINSFGYSFTADDLLVAYDNSNTSIASVLDGVDLDNAVRVSREAGFSSDVDKVGGVTLILANDGDDIITLYLVDGEIELCFVQTIDGDAVSIKSKTDGGHNDA